MTNETNFNEEIVNEVASAEEVAVEETLLTEENGEQNQKPPFNLKKFLHKIKFDKWKAWLYLSPALVLLAIFTLWPIINTLRMAFLEGYNGFKAVGGETFEFGLGNFEKVIEYKNFKRCLETTMLLCVLTVPISTFLALLIAVCLNSIKFLSRFLQTIFFLPYVTNSIAIGMVFAAMFDIVGTNVGRENAMISTYGIINNIIGIFGIEPISWTNSNSTPEANIFVNSVSCKENTYGVDRD